MRKRIPQSLRKQTQRVVVLISVVALLGTSGRTAEEGFESPNPTWQVREKDCAFRVDQHRRVFDVAHSGNGSEHLRYWCGQGTKILLVHPIEAARVIEELTPSVWIRSNRANLQLFARVVLPRSREPGTNRPMTRLLPGGVYTDVGTWQQLKLEDIRLALNRQVRTLRGRFDNVEDAEAYIDMLVLNIYGGSGWSDLWIDDLRIEGFATSSTAPQPETTIPVSQPAVGSRRPPGPEPPSSDPAAAEPPRLTGNVLVVDGHPFFPKIVEHNGEPFYRLADLGFNVVALPGTPLPAQLEEAREAGIWLIAPPPMNVDSWPQGPSQSSRAGQTPWDRVLAWDLGVASTAEEAEIIRNRARQIRSGSQQARLLVAELAEHAIYDSRSVDLVRMGRETAGTSFELADLGAWLTQRVDQLGDQPFWANVQTEIAQDTLAQVMAMSPDQIVTPSLEPEQLILQAFTAAASGARGLFYRSRSRLDEETPQTRLRAATLKLINRQLVVVRPWLTAGTPFQRHVTMENGIQVSRIQTERSVLILMLRHLAQQQYSIPDWSNQKTVDISPERAGLGSDAYQIVPDGIRRVRRSPRSPNRITIRPNGMVTMAVITTDPLVVNYLGRKTGETKRDLAQLSSEIARIQLDETRAVVRKLQILNRTQQDTEQGLRETALLLDRAEQVMRTGDSEASRRFTVQATSLLRQIRSRYWLEASFLFPSPVSSPLCTSFSTLPAHWRLQDRLRWLNWGPNQLAGSEFEDMQHLVRSGWSLHQSTNPALGTAAELSLTHPRTGRAALQLRAWAREEDISLTEWPLQIVSAPVYTRRGQLVRIRGWVNMAGPIQNSLEGLMIFDSQTGLGTAERVRSTRGWQEFSLYRVANADGELSVVFTLSGLGQVLLDDVTIHVAE